MPIAQGINATEVNPTTWNELVDAINANTAGISVDGVSAFADGDTDPSVADNKVFKTANTGATVITTFDDGTDGQRITIIADDANTTITPGATLKCNAGADLDLEQYDIVEFILHGSVWCCTSYQQNTV